jgi:hypothetical protein
MVTVVPASHDGDMIWWVLASAIFVVVGLVYVMAHESDLCAGRSAEPIVKGVKRAR